MPMKGRRGVRLIILGQGGVSEDAVDGVGDQVVNGAPVVIHGQDDEAVGRQVLGEPSLIEARIPPPR